MFDRVYIQNVECIYTTTNKESAIRERGKTAEHLADKNRSRFGVYVKSVLNICRIVRVGEFCFSFCLFYISHSLLVRSSGSVGVSACTCSIVCVCVCVCDRECVCPRMCKWALFICPCTYQALWAYGLNCVYI